MLGVGPAGAQRETDARVVIRRDGLAVVRRPEDIDAGRHRAIQEVGLRETRVDQGTQGTERQTQVRFLALAQQIALPQRDIAQDAGRGREAGTERNVAGTLLDHLHFEVGLVRRRAGRGRDVGLLEEAEVAQALLAAPHLGGREGVALGQAELAPDHLVQRSRVARDVDALDVDAWAFLDVEGHVDRELVLVALDIGTDFDEGVAQRTDDIAERRHRLLDRVGVEPLARRDGQVALQHVDIETLEARRHLDLAELVARAFAYRDCDEEAFTIGRQLGHRRYHAEVGIALRQVELAQQFAVEIEAVRIVAVVRRQEAVPGAFHRADLAAQRAVAEGLVADETDALHAGHVAFVDLEDEIDTALLQLDDLGFDGGVVAAAAAIDGEDALDVGLDARPGEDLARFGLHFVAQLIVLDLLVTLEGDAVDDRVFRDLHDQGRALHVDRDIGEQAGAEQCLQRPVCGRRIVGLAFLELQVGPDGLRLGADIALNLHGGDRSAHGSRGPTLLSVRHRAERHNCRKDQYSPTKYQTYPRRLPDLPATFRTAFS